MPSSKPFQAKIPCIKCLDAVGFGCRRIGRFVACFPSNVRRLLSPECAARSRAAVKSWTERNYAASRASSEAWRKKNLVHRANKIRVWRKRNPGNAAIYERKQLQKPARRLAQNIRRRVRDVLLRRWQSASTLTLLGCTAQELVSHIEARFSEGMTWENYGVHGWHIDHKRPLASFNLLNAEEQREAFHYSNLQPMWAKLNIQKHAKWQPN